VQTPIIFVVKPPVTAEDSGERWKANHFDLATQTSKMPNSFSLAKLSLIQVFSLGMCGSQDASW
jgi:hypothetical protein